MKWSIVIPAYNEERRIGVTLKDYGSYFSRFPKGSVEIIVVLNGCHDNTLKIVKGCARKYHLIHYIDIPQAIGKGGAVVKGFKRARGKLVGFADADGATAAEQFAQLAKKLDGADGVIASRWMPGAIVEPRQPLKRRIASRCFNMFVKVLFGLHFYDTQCGCKLFKREVVREVLPSLGLTRWAFDVDLLYNLKRHNRKVREIPTVWKDRTGSSIHVPKVSLEMLLAIIRLRLLYSPFRFIVGIYNHVAAFFGIRL